MSKQLTTADDLIRQSDAAKLLNPPVSRQRLYQLIEQGMLPTVTRFGLRLVRRADLSRLAGRPTRNREKLKNSSSAKRA